ncbi:adenosine deaminase [Lentzea sp. NBRC 105346]|uniref:adenosine deaminase n=1 Tax=Lentzea sp. NBRC 105346 TaxID=3032205 RepID=UPI0024A4CF09|nr:adenosine deaminase [Lentzea sp. NBRC 105346]GLZ34166.1 adenosine deaminase [Lentzea sp. NBRC 105346]
MHKFIFGLPKAELNVHLVGAASADTVLTLTRRHPSAGVPTDETELRKFYEFTDFDHFVDVYVKVNSLVQTGEDVSSLVDGLAEDLAFNNVRYAEVTVSAVSHIDAGVAPDELKEALQTSRRKALAVHGVHLAWIFDIPGLRTPGEEQATLDFALRQRPEGTVAFGLAGQEAGRDRESYRWAFDIARDAGLHCVPHAGEMTGPATIWAALRALRAERIGHGISAIADPPLLKHLADNAIPLEVCPTSNLRTNVVRTPREHPLPALLDAGIVVTLNTDDPGMFHTDLNSEYLFCHQEFGLGRSELADLARNSVTASFAPDALKTQLLTEISAHTKQGSP